MPTRLTRTIKHAEKKYMINSRGFFKRKEPISVSMPYTRKKKAKRAIAMFFPHQKPEPMNLDPLYDDDIPKSSLHSNVSISRTIVKPFACEFRPIACQAKKKTHIHAQRLSTASG
jgi:hypothetical protein